ncbi:MAG: DNA-formamidopyrimidine glycosylase family protein [Nocardioidaceae bacterium]
MPEGDVVWRAATRLRETLAGRPLTTSDFRVPRLATVDLSGRQVLDVVSRGKHLLLRVEPDHTVHVHLRMDGEWHLYRPGARHHGRAWQIRLILGNDAWEAVGYRLPVVELLPTADEARVVGHLGPDPLGPDWDAAEACRRLAADPDRMIGDALLDQRTLAGIGNLYKAEVCFLRGISPWRRVTDVDDLPGLVDLARRLLDANKNRVGQVTTGTARPGHDTWVYGRTARPCRRCGTTIKRAVQGNRLDGRVTYWCPRCQPLRTLRPGPA